MNDSPTARHRSPAPIDIRVIEAHLTVLADLDSCDACDVPLTRAVIDIVRLLGHVDHLTDAVRVARLDAANLRAGIRAAVGARADGEPDPWGYLRDELPPEDLRHLREQGWQV